MTDPDRSDARTVLARLSNRLPANSVALVERSGRGQVARAAAAASVVLVREDDDGMTTYLLHRHDAMPFAAGMVVFPGGRVEPGETTADCALRETREETGVVLDGSRLRRWAHWITPEYERRRYDTQFFVARLPDGATAQDVSGETERADWQRPGEALADLAAGRIGMLPPTISILLELADLPTWSAVEAAAQDRVIAPVLPRVVRRQGQWVFDYTVVVPPQPR